MSRTTDGAVVFDFDGTLVLGADTDPAVADIVMRHGASADRTVLMEIIRAANSDWALVSACVPSPAREKAYAEILAASAGAAASSQCDVELAPMLAVLRSRHRLFIVSGRDEASLRTMLDRHRLMSYFEAIVAAAPGVAEKPDPAPLKDLRVRYSLRTEAIAYVGDKDIDHAFATRAGVAFVGATWYCDRLTIDCAKVTRPAALPDFVTQAFRARSAAV
jgi:phosphoglycolate phosphatase-like HAD superfamily hydrolase